MKNNNSNIPENIVLKPDIVKLHDMHLNMLSKDLEDFNKLGHRDSKLFNWLLWAFENLGLSTIEKNYLTSLALVKTRFSIFEVLIDDIIDDKKNRNLDLFEELLNIPFDSERINYKKLTKIEIDYLEYAKTIWNEIAEEIKTYPNYEKYKEALRFDIYQMLNSMRYSRFVNIDSDAVNLLENKVYVPHGMIVLIQLDFDLMCSKTFDNREFGQLREVGYLSQILAKVGNTIATYPRELLEEDMSSEAIIRFLKDYGPGFKFKLNKYLNKKSRYPKFELDLIKDWEEQYKIVKELSTKIKSVDMQQFIREREFLQQIYKLRGY